MTIPFNPQGFNNGWCCPKCGRVYAPWVYTCTPCDPGTFQVPSVGTGTPFTPYKPFTGGGSTPGSTP